jgi:D-glycero-D-manno-heptose 1,7-bisphosphate phosphatase
MGLLKKVVFLDRDGTINVDSADYIKSRSEFEFIPGSIQAIRDLTHNGYTVIIITNQSALARKLVSPEELDAMHAMMCCEVASAGGDITDIFFCPHLPDDGCECRKPAPGLIDQASQKYDIELADSIMVGDSAKDIACGRNAGCGKTVLVKSGLGRDVEKELMKKSIAADFVAQNLREAAGWILSGRGESGPAEKMS